MEKRAILLIISPVLTPPAAAIDAISTGSAYRSEAKPRSFRLSDTVLSKMEAFKALCIRHGVQRQLSDAMLAGDEIAIEKALRLDAKLAPLLKDAGLSPSSFVNGIGAIYLASEPSSGIGRANEATRANRAFISGNRRRINRFLNDLRPERSHVKQ